MEDDDSEGKVGKQLNPDIKAMPQRGMEMETEPSKDFTLSPPSQQQQHDEQEGNIEASLDVIKAGDNVKYSQQPIVNPPQEKNAKDPPPQAAAKDPGS